MREGNALSDELVPSTRRSSSFREATNRKMLNPASRAINPSTPKTKIAHDQADDEREGGDDLEVDEGLEADAADFLGVLDMGDARDDGAKYDRRDDHLDQLDETVAHRLDPIALRVLGREPSEEHAENDGDQHLNVEQLVPRLSARHGGCGGMACNARHDFLLDVLLPRIPRRGPAQPAGSSH